MSQQPPTVPQNNAAQSRSGGGAKVLIWIAAGCGIIVVIIALVLLVGGIFLSKKVGDFAKDPEIAAVKMVAAADPDIEIVTIDEDDRTVTLRNKKTGEEITVNLTEIREGKIGFSDGEGKSVRVDASGEGESGMVKVESSEGTFTMGQGSGGDLPGWVPVYGGNDPEGFFASSSAGRMAGGFNLSTQDKPADVLKFYEVSLKGKGFQVSSSTFQQNGAVSGGLVHGERTDPDRRVTVNLSLDNGKTLVVVGYEEAEGE